VAHTAPAAAADYVHPPSTSQAAPYSCSHSPAYSDYTRPRPKEAQGQTQHPYPDFGGNSHQKHHGCCRSDQDLHGRFLQLGDNGRTLRLTHQCRRRTFQGLASWGWGGRRRREEGGRVVRRSRRRRARLVCPIGIFWCRSRRWLHCV